MQRKGWSNINIKSKGLPLLNSRTPRIKSIVRTRQLAKKAGVHSARQHKVNLGTDRSLVITESSDDDFWLKSLADF